MSDEFVDEAPATVYAKLLDQGTYLASVSTMYRVLHEHDEVRERCPRIVIPSRHEIPESRPPRQLHVELGHTKLHGLNCVLYLRHAWFRRTP